MFVITGGAGFIGSVLANHLNQKGKNRILLVDHLGLTQKWRNIVHRDYYLTIHKDDFPDWLNQHGDRHGIEAIFHMGACSSTAEHNMDYLLKNNVHYSIRLFDYCQKRQIPFIYASSAATYGDGSAGYEDSHENLHNLRPINPYGLSKHMFDLWVLKQKQYPPFWAGLKFFNVYGPNEYHKGDMCSLVCKAVPQIEKTGKLRLFKSGRPDIPHGEQKRDFIYVKDAVKIMIHLLDSFTDPHLQSPESGIYNVGTGQARSFADLGRAVFRALNKDPQFEWIETPDSVKPGYQYFTQSCQKKLKDLGLYKQSFITLEEGVIDYVKNYLSGGIRYL